MEESLGIIETLGYATGMEAADAAIKSANIKLADWVYAGSGKVNIIIRGDVAAVKTAVEAGVTAASRIGEVMGQAVIPRPADNLKTIFPISPLEEKKK
jgi:ethanolamine utilization protein EutM